MHKCSHDCVRLSACACYFYTYLQSVILLVNSPSFSGLKITVMRMCYVSYLMHHLPVWNIESEGLNFYFYDFLFVLMWFLLGRVFCVGVVVVWACRCFCPKYPFDLWRRMRLRVICHFLSDALQELSCLMSFVRRYEVRPLFTLFHMFSLSSHLSMADVRSLLLEGISLKRTAAFGNELSAYSYLASFAPFRKRN
jgi:hypothetical protein